MAQTTAQGQPQPFAADFKEFAVAADQAIASQAGAEILAIGGNAVDAAVATSFTLSVVRPYSCGIGGGGFMLVYFPDHPKLGHIARALDYREVAPSFVQKDYYEKLDAAGEPSDSSLHGAHAVGVPGTVVGLLFALDHYGTLTREQVLGPAIRAAEEGFTVDAHYVESVQDLLKYFANTPAAKQRFSFVWKRFLKEGAVKVGDTITLPEQARAFRLIAQQGADAFTKGEIAQAIAATLAADGARWAPTELATNIPIESPPIQARFRGRTLLTMPPPSCGVTVLETLGILDRLPTDLALLGHNTPAYVHIVAEASKVAFSDRSHLLADPAFVPVPIATLLSDGYLIRNGRGLDPAHTHPPEWYGLPMDPPKDHGTSHFSVIDKDGNAVSCTETINEVFGSLLAVPEFGFVLNNEMDDFTTRSGKANGFGLKQSDLNLPAPGKRPLSSMTPVIALAGDDTQSKVELVVGGSGGPRIISGTLQAILSSTVFGLSAGEAVERPRFHHQWLPDVLYLEPALRGTSLEASMKEHGHQVDTKPAVANVQLIRRTAEGWSAASDPRKGGVPAGR